MSNTLKEQESELSTPKTRLEEMKQLYSNVDFSDVVDVPQASYKNFSNTDDYKNYIKAKTSLESAQYSSDIFYGDRDRDADLDYGLRP